MSLAQSTRTVGDIATAVKRQFGDESGTQINNTDIVRWVNEGQSEIVRLGEVNKGIATTPSVAGQNTYTFSDNIIKVIGLFYNNSPLTYVSFEQAQESFLYQPTDTSSIKATPTNWYEFDESIILYPTPNNTSDEIKLYAIKAPTVVTSTGDTLSIPDTHYNSLLQFVLQQAYELDEDYSAASVKAAQMNDSISSLMDTSNYSTYPTITIMPEDQ